MRIIIIFLTLSLLTPFTFINAQNIITKDPGEFNSISVMGNIRTEIFPSEENRMEIEAEGTTPENVIIENKNKEISLKLHNSTPREALVTVKIFYTELTSLSAASNAYILSADTLKADHLYFKARTGGKIELKLKLLSLKADVTQAGLMVFFGSVLKQEIRATSSGAYSAYDLVATNTIVKASTTAIAKVNTTQSLDATAKLSGFVGYKGNPEKISLNRSIGGEIIDYSEE